jgi:hypothetical protein
MFLIENSCIFFNKNKKTMHFIIDIYKMKINFLRRMPWLETILSPNIKLVLFKKKKKKHPPQSIEPLGTWAPLLPVRPIFRIDHVTPKQIYIQIFICNFMKLAY